MEHITLGLDKTVSLIGYANYQALYLDWINNFLTVDGFAAHHHIDAAVALQLIDNARCLYAD